MPSSVHFPLLSWPQLYIYIFFLPPALLASGSPSLGQAHQHLRNPLSLFLTNLLLDWAPAECGYSSFMFTRAHAACLNGGSSAPVTHLSLSRVDGCSAPWMTWECKGIQMRDWEEVADSGQKETEFEQALGIGDGQGSLACWSPRGLRSRAQMSDYTELKVPPSLTGWICRPGIPRADGWMWSYTQSFDYGVVGVSGTLKPTWARG